MEKKEQLWPRRFGGRAAEKGGSLGTSPTAPSQGAGECQPVAKI